MNYVGDGEDQLSGTETLNDFHLDSLKTLMIGGYGHCTERILHGGIIIFILLTAKGKK